MQTINSFTARRFRSLFLFWLATSALLLCGPLRVKAEYPDILGKSFPAQDSLSIDADSIPDANQCLDGLRWQPGDFSVQCERPLEWRYDAIVRFPSPLSTGDERNDQVAMEWHMARDEQGDIVAAPAVIVVHESGRGMTVGRTFALLLSRHRLHTFLVQLPGYGERRDKSKPESTADMMIRMRQGVADVRRARDAALTLPLVDNDHVALQGTSLGGFVSSTVAGLDNGFDSVFLMLSGGNLFDVLQQGDRDAEKMRQRLQQEGVTAEKLREMLYVVEPNRLAHRLRPHSTWLFSGRTDTVVPLESALSLVKAAKLPSEHHVILEADHYSGVVFIPDMIKRVHDEIQTLRKQESLSE